MYDNRFVVTTQNGSLYLIDPDSQTWERTGSTGRSGPLRTDSGVYDVLTIELGKPMVIEDEGLAFGRRYIITSDVVNIAAVEQKAAG